MSIAKTLIRATITITLVKVVECGLRSVCVNVASLSNWKWLPGIELDPFLFIAIHALLSSQSRAEPVREKGFNKLV